MALNRRKFLKGASVAGVGAGAAVIAGCSQEEASAPAAPAVVKNELKLRMTTSWPKGFPGLGTAADDFAANLTKISGGRISVEVFGAGEIAPGLKAQDAVADGSADFYHSAEYYYLGKSKALAFFSTVPFGMTATEVDAWIHQDGGQELWDEIAAPLGYKPFMCANSGVQAGGWFNKEINSAEDLKGLNIRMPGLGGEALRRLGANAVTLAGGEIGPALQAGTIDATEWVGPWNDYAFGLNKLAKFYYTSGFHEPGTVLSLGMNKEIYDNLDEADQAMVAAAAAMSHASATSAFHANSGEFLARIKDEGTEIREFPDDVWDAFGKASAEVLEESAAEDATFKKVYDSMKASMTKNASWLATSEGTYLAQRNRVIGL